MTMTNKTPPASPAATPRERALGSFANVGDDERESKFRAAAAAAELRAAAAQIVTEPLLRTGTLSGRRLHVPTLPTGLRDWELTTAHRHRLAVFVAVIPSEPTAAHVYRYNEHGLHVRLGEARLLDPAQLNQEGGR